MADQQDGQNEKPEQTNQGAAVPTAQQTTPEPQEQQTAQETQALPEDAKERTRREFDKLTAQLRDERARREYAEAVAKTYTPPTPTQEEPTIYDSETGLINEQVFTESQRKAQEAYERATRAEQTLQSYQKDQEDRELYSAYPELDSNEKHGQKFDKELFKEIRKIYLDSAVNPEDYGGQLSLKQAADIIKKSSNQTTEAAKEQGAKEAIENLTPKEQASLEATGSPNRAAALDADAEEEDLRYRARKGDDYAMTELLRRRNTSSEG